MANKPPFSAEDRALFLEMMKDVIPLTQKKRHLKAPPKCASRTVREEIALSLSDYDLNPIHAESHLSFRREGIQQQHLKHLKSKQFVYESKLDLHGLRADEAKLHLSRFIQEAITHQHRWLLIIHGKGGRFGEAPIIKTLVNHWLRQIPEVLAFETAQKKHGSAGAVYVLLKRGFVK